MGDGRGFCRVCLEGEAVDPLLVEAGGRCFQSGVPGILFFYVLFLLSG